MSSNQQNIVPKDFSYQCGTRIFWNTAENTYCEVFTKQKHICKNRSKPILNNSVMQNKPTCYNRFTKQPKPKTSNSIEMISGCISEVQRKYEILSDIVTDLGGKCHGSQSHINGNNISLVVYYEVPIGQRDEVKRKFANMIRNTITLNQRNY